VICVALAIASALPNKELDAAGRSMFPKYEWTMLRSRSMSQGLLNLPNLALWSAQHWQ
jgi:hypothetical protein